MLWGVVATLLLLGTGGLASEAGSQEGLPSIAVIPFDNLANEENQYFTDGIHEDILTALHKAGGMNGPELATVVLERFPGFPIVFTSGYSRDALPEAGELTKQIPVLTKPFKRDGIATIVRETLDWAKTP